jgi:outer membrane protein assembly factor BamE (lipoprotein component of BamABCDE complex)
MMKYSFLLLALILLGACTSTVRLENFDSEAWKKDNMGCEGKRAAMVNELLDQQLVLRGKTQQHIMRILGKPDKVELYDRSQTFHFYYLDATEGCKTDSLVANPRFLSVRFTALNQASEFIILNK